MEEGSQVSKQSISPGQVFPCALNVRSSFSLYLKPPFKTPGDPLSYSQMMLHANLRYHRGTAGDARPVEPSLNYRQLYHDHLSIAHLFPATHTLCDLFFEGFSDILAH